MDAMELEELAKSRITIDPETGVVTLKMDVPYGNRIAFTREAAEAFGKVLIESAAMKFEYKE